MRGEEMGMLRIAARTIAGALFVAGLTVPFGTALAQSKQPLSFKSVDVALPGVTFTSVLGINAQGDIVGRYAVGSVGHGYLLNDGTYTTIDAPDGVGSTQAQGINEEGQIVGFYTVPVAKTVDPTGLFTRSFLREPDGTFSSIQFPGSNNTLAIKISPRGKVVGCFHNLSFDTSTTMHGFVLHDGNYEEFPMPGSMHNGIARNGRLIVGVVFPDMATFHAYKMHDGVTEMIDPPDAVVSDARDVNPLARLLDFSSIQRIRRMGSCSERATSLPSTFQGKTWSRHRHAASTLRATSWGSMFPRTPWGNCTHTGSWQPENKDKDEDEGK